MCGTREARTNIFPPFNSYLACLCILGEKSAIQLQYIGTSEMLFFWGFNLQHQP